MDYRRDVLNQFALNQLSVRVDLPATRLGIGDAELLSPVGFKLEYKKNMPTATIPDYGSQAYETAAWDGQGNKVHPEDFPTSSFYYGNPIMGVS